MIIKTHGFIYSYCDYIQGIVCGNKKIGKIHYLTLTFGGGRSEAIGRKDGSAKLLVKMLLVTLLLGITPVSHGENYYVLASYNDPAKALAQQTTWKEALAVDFSVREFTLPSGTWYRILHPEVEMTEALLQRLQDQGIKPWRVTIKAAAHSSFANSQASGQKPIMTTGNTLKVLLRVGEFTDIESALSLERQLVTADLPVFGKAALADATVLHQVWLGPLVKTPDLTAKLLTLGLDVAEETLEAPALLTKPAPNLPPGSSPSLSGGHLAQPASHKNAQPYPDDYNPARLSPQKPEPWF